MKYQQYKRMRNNELELTKVNILLSIRKASERGQAVDELIERLLAVRLEIANRQAVTREDSRK